MVGHDEYAKVAKMAAKWYQKYLMIPNINFESTIQSLISVEYGININKHKPNGKSHYFSTFLVFHVLLKIYIFSLHADTGLIQTYQIGLNVIKTSGVV